MTDYRRRDGWSRDGKRGAVRIERIPGAVSSVLDISSPQDYRMLADVIPDGEFTAAEFAAAKPYEAEVRVVSSEHPLQRRGDIEMREEGQSRSVHGGTRRVRAGASAF